MYILIEREKSIWKYIYQSGVQGESIIEMIFYVHLHCIVLFKVKVLKMI